MRCYIGQREALERGGLNDLLHILLTSNDIIVGAGDDQLLTSCAI